MASFEKPKAPEAKPENKMITASASENVANSVENKAKMARHDQQHDKDMDLAHKLQRAWEARVREEHSNH